MNRLDWPAVALTVQRNVPLAGLTTLGVGGDAACFAEALTEREVAEAVDFSRARDLPLLVLGGGSNLLAADRGFAGLALRVVIGGMTLTDEPDRTRVRAGAGVEWDALVAECVRRNLYGVECLSGIPGWVGATPVQNVGAYGQDVSGVIRSVRVFDRDRGEARDLAPAECRFDYRSSVFNTTARGRYIVLGVDYVLARSGPPTLHYPDLARAFAGRSVEPTPAEVREAVRAIRATKAMLLAPGDPDCRSAGSFFKNPVVTEDQLAAMQAAAPPGEEVPVFPAQPGYRKTPAAWLIERAGYPRGYVDGAVGLSRRHALALVNRGGATAGDVLRLAGAIQDRVEARFGVRLVPEPVFVGFPEEVIRRFGAVSI